MKKGLLILLLGLLVGAGAFAGFYYVGTSSCRAMLSGPEPELAWLKQEFKLSDAEYDRVVKLHLAYLPDCANRCLTIEAQNHELQKLLRQATTITPEIEASLQERAKTRANCEAQMLKHFLAVSQSMPAEQGQRYLAWVEQQTFLNSQGMEQRHRDQPLHPAGHPSHH